VLTHSDGVQPKQAQNSHYGDCRIKNLAFASNFMTVNDSYFMRRFYKKTPAAAPESIFSAGR